MAIEAQLADGRVLRFPDGTKPEVIDSVVQNLLAEDKPAPAQISASAPTPELTQPLLSGEFDAGLPTTGTGAEKTQPKAPGFTSVLQGREPEYDEAALIRASRRKFVESGVKDAERLTAVGKQKLDMQAAARERMRKEAKDENYGFLDFAKDTGIDLSKGVVGLGESYVGLLNLTSGGAAGKVLNRMGYSPDRTTEFLNGFQSLTRKNARQNVKEAEGFINNLVALAVNPTELLGSVVQSLPGTVAAGSVGGKFVRSIMGKATLEAEGLGLVGQQAKDFIVQKVKDQTYRIAAVAGGAEGAMTAGSIAEKARQKDRDWSEYVMPAITAGFGTAALSAVSGKAAQKLGIGDVETSIAARSAGVKGVATGEGSYIAKMLKGVAKEGFLEEMPQSAQEQMFTNLATGRPWDENVSKAAAQGLMAGMAMAGGHTTLVSALQKTSELAKEPGAPVQVVPEEKRVEPTFDEAAFMQPAPPAATAPTPPTPPTPTPAAPTPVAQTAETAEQIKEIAARLQRRGISRRAALAMAEAEVNAKLKAEAKTAATKLPEGRVEEITQELIAAGVPPQQAKIDAQALAQEEAQADELAQTEAGGTPNVARPISEPIGTSTALVEQPSAEPTAAGVGDDQRNGVVPAGPATTDTAAGEGAQPAALTPANFFDGMSDKVLDDLTKSAAIGKPLRDAAIAEKQRRSAPKPQPKDATLYHGTNVEYETIDPSKSGGMAFFGEDLSTAERYAQNGGGGRARLDNTQKYIVTDRGVVYELDGDSWKAVGIAPEGGLINKSTIQPLDKAYPSLSQAEAENITNPDSGTAGVVPKTSRIITQDFSGLKLLDISTPEGRNVIAGLTPSTQVGSGLVNAAKFDAQDKTDRNSTTQLNSNFWSLTKYSSAYGDQLKKDIVEPLKALGYDGIRFADDQHSSVGLFDTGLKKEKTTPETPAETKSVEETEAERIKAEDEQTAAYEAKKDKARSIARSNASAAFDQAGEYGSLDEALDSYRTNMVDTLAEEGLRNDPDYVYLLAAAERAFEAEVNKQRGTTTDGTATTETVQAETQKQEAPAAGAVTKGKRGRPPSPHVVVKNAEGGFDHVLNGEVLGSYANQKQATAAVNLAKAKDKGDAALIATNQAKLDAALASKGRGRPEKAPTEDGAPTLDNEAKSEIAALESALETYNSPAEQESILNAAMYIDAVANDTSLPKAVRERAQQMLDEDVDPKDVARGKTLRSSDAKVGKADTGFSKLTNGSQAIAHIVKTGNFFQRFVAQRIRNFLVGVKFVVVERGDSIPAEMEGARGLFVYTPGTKERTVYVRGASFGNQQGINAITVLHELLHAATASRIEAGLLKGFKNASLQKFMREMEGLMKRAQEAYEEAEMFGELSPEMQELVANTTDIDKKTGRPVIGVFVDPHEFLAYGMSNPDFQRFLMGVQGKRTEMTGFAKFVADIRDLFGIGAKDATAFTDLVDITDKMLGTRLTPVKTKRTALQQKGKFTPPDFDEQADLRAKRSATTLERDALKAKQKVAESREGDMAEAVKAMQNARDPSKVRDILARAWSKMSYLQREAAVRMPTFDFLSKWAAENGISSLRQTNMYLERMLGMSQQFLAGSEQIIGMLDRGFKEDKNLSRKQFENFVYATTIAEMDPSDPNAVERSKTLDADYKALGPVGQRMYKDLRNYYEGIIELYSDLLDDQIQNAKGLSQEDKNNLMATLRKTFEAKARIRPYFPLVRRGDFWLAIGSGDDRRRFYTFESREDRNAKAAELAAGRGDDIEDLLFRQEFTQGNSLSELRMASKDSSQMLKQTFDAIDRMEMGDDALGSGSAKEGLKDAVYQIYLNTMPEQTFRKQFTHRKNVIGFSTDIQQNIATTATKQAIQLSRLKYAPLLRNSLSAARDAIREREELSPFVEEAEKRINLALSGQSGGLSNAVAGVANKASFFWFLSGASSALIQPSSVFISGLPVLAGNYNDTAGAAKELGKMTLLVNQYSIMRTNSDGTTSISAPSIANNKSLPADERRAVSEMVSRGVAESTYASMVWGYQRTPTESTYFSLDKGFANIPVAYGKGKKLANFLVGALMHNTERLSREAVYLAAYRLGKKQGLSYDAAVQKAVESTNEALGNYDVTNKPRFMQQGIGKVAFQFKTYPLQMTLLLLTNFKRMLPFLNKEGKKEAATKFFGMMGTSFLLAGASNMALFSPIIGLVGWAWSKMSAEEDWPEELKDISFESWFRLVFLPEKLGDVKIGGVPVSDIIDRGPLNAITGYDIASRIGLNDLWGRDSKETKTARESAIAFVLDNFAGPTGSLFLGFMDAWDAYTLGDYQKMQEKLAPAAIRNLLVANKYADDGMKTGRGVELVNKDDIKTGELIGQSIGFRPDILAATQGPAFKFSGIEQEILNQRNLLLNKLDFQLRKDTDEGDKRFNQILEKEVSKFNLKHPSYELTDEAIDNSLEKKAEQRGATRAGVPLTEKNIPIVEEATNYLERRLDARVKEMQERREKEKSPR